MMKVSENVLLDAIHSNRRAMMNVADELVRISELLHEMNMQRLSDRIYGLANTVEHHAKNVSDAFGSDLHERVAEGEAMTGRIILGLLTNIEKAPKQVGA